MVVRCYQWQGSQEGKQLLLIIVVECTASPESKEHAFFVLTLPPEPLDSDSDRDCLLAGTEHWQL